MTQTLVKPREEAGVLAALRHDLETARAEHGRGSTAASEAFLRLFREAARRGEPLDALRNYTENEVERFFAQTIPGPSGHVYWSGSRDFVQNDGRHRTPRRWWWVQKLGHDIDNYVDVVSVCGEKNCINPEHCDSGRNLRRPRKFTDEQMLDAIRAVAKRLGHPPTAREWKDLGGSPTRNVFMDRFDSWPNVLKEAGLPFVQIAGRKASPEVCIRSLRFARQVIGRWPTREEFLATAPALQDVGLPSSPNTIRKHLGGWHEALRKAGAR